MFELSAWDTLVYTLLVLALMLLLSKLLAEPAPAVRIRDNKNGHRSDFVLPAPKHLMNLNHYTCTSCTCTSCRCTYTSCSCTSFPCT